MGESVEISTRISTIFRKSGIKVTADAVYQKFDIIRDELPKYVMVLVRGPIFIAKTTVHIPCTHVESGAKMTVSTIAVPIEQARNAFGVISIDENSKIIEFAEKPRNQRR